MMLRCSRKYDIKTDSIVYANNQPYTRENYRSASVGDSADALFNFCRSMCILKVDNAEYALLTAIVIFSGKSFEYNSHLNDFVIEFIDNLLMESIVLSFRASISVGAKKGGEDPGVLHRHIEGIR